MGTTTVVNTEWARTARLLRRCGFGTTGAEVDAAVAVGATTWVSRSLGADPATDPGARSTPTPDIPVLEKGGKGLTTDQRKARNATVAEQRRTALTWWLRRMAAVESPLSEKLTFGWHQHFATAVKTVRSPRLMVQQNETQRRLGLGSFTALASAMVTDPAMLRWLDGDSNTAAAPNENLSREFMELFALGHGNGYTEQDVREGARALTGWTIDADGTARLVARRHDATRKTVLGRTGDLGAEDFVEAVLAQPASARYLATRWWKLLVAPTPPPDDALARMVASYGPRRDLRALFTTMLTEPAMAASAGSLVVTPVEWAIGAVRALRVPLADAKDATTLGRTLTALGQVPFLPPSVAGWPSGQAWLSTASAQTRLRAATAFAAAGDLDDVAAAAPSSRPEVVAHRLGIPTLSDRTVVALRTVSSDPAKLVAAALVSPEYLVN